MNRKSVFSVLASILCMMLVLLSSITAFAYNNDYLSSDKWENNANVSTYPFDITNAFGNELKGSISYYDDEESYTLYMKLSFSETSMSSKNNISLDFDFHNPYESFLFSINQKGKVSSPYGDEKFFKIGSSIEFQPKYNSVDIIAAVEIENGYSTNYVDIGLTVNGTRYKLVDELEMVAPEKPTTTKPAKATTTKAKKTTAKSNKTTSKSIKSKNKTNAQTKYHAAGQPSKKYYANSNEVEIDYEEQTDSPTPYTPIQNYNPENKTLSKNSIIFLIAAIAVALISVIIIVIGLILIIKGRKEAKEEDKKTPNDDDDFEF